MQLKNALSKGDYPVDLEKVADALLQAYKDIKIDHNVSNY